MGSMLSIEALFWAPLGMDVMLLLGTYSACKLSGLGWYLNEMKKHTEKKNDDDDELIAKLVKDESHPIHSVWDIAMTAYSAYGCVSLHISFIICLDFCSPSVLHTILPRFSIHSFCHGQHTLPTRIRLFVSHYPGR